MKFTFTLCVLLSCFSLFAQKSLNQEDIKISLNKYFSDEGLRLYPDEHASHADYLFKQTTLDKIEIDGQATKIFLDIPQKTLQNDFDEHAIEDYILVLQNELFNLGANRATFLVKNDSNDYVDLVEYIRKEEAPSPVYVTPRNDDPFPNRAGDLERIKSRRSNFPYFGQAQPSGALSGKTVWLSPGHGWIYYTSLGTFSTQRGETNDMVEDFGTTECVTYYLLNYLWNAGANVWMVRERDYNTNEVIVNNDDGSGGGYTETGAWTTSGSGGYNSTYRFVNSGSTESATATFTPTIPESGWYWVSVYFREGANRSVDTRYTVHHAGGQTTVSVNQEVHGQTWNYLGQFYFDAGSTGKVVLSNQSGETGQAIIADAVRFGGGMGSEPDCDEPAQGLSGKPRFEEGAQLYTHFMGYPSCYGDVSIRPRYAEWELSKGAASEQNDLANGDVNSLYVSWHTNAGGGSGTSSFIYEPGTAGTSDSGSPTNCTGSAGNANASGYLRNYIHDEVIDDIRTYYDASWTNRGKKCAYFGEINPSYLTTMPSALFEMGFHDNAADAEDITTPRFRMVEARAVYQGIVKFFNHYDNSIPTVSIADAPTHLVGKNAGSGQITLTWDAPSTTDDGGAATAYKVYMSTHGKGFADGVAVGGTSYTFTGLAPSTNYYFRVTATNAGGESFPTSVVAVRTPPAGSTVAPILIVDGFDRLQRSQMIIQTSSSQLTDLRRGFLERMNSYTYMVEHAKSMSNCIDLGFDGATNEAVIANDIALTDYDLVDWFCGEESTSDRTLDDTEQARVQTFLDGGGCLIISGAEIGWDIGRSTSGNAAVSFYNNYLKASYAGDDGGTYSFSGAAAPYSGTSGTFDDSSLYYDVNFPDRLGAAGGSSVVVNYSGGTGDGAATAYKGTDFGVVNFGFPLETVTSESVRDELICNALNFLCSEILAVEGLELTGTVEKRQNRLQWSTLIETSTDYFELQKSINGFRYETVGKVAAAGNSTEQQFYELIDESPYPKTYYRVKVINLDGTVDYSNVIELNQNQLLSVSLFPNPASTNFINLSLDTDIQGAVEFQLFDALGKLVVQQKWDNVQDNFYFKLPTLSSGVYNYNIKIDDLAVKGGKFVKL